MGTQRVQMKGIHPLLDRWTRHACTIDFCSVLAALGGPVQNIFSSPYTTVPIPQQAGQAGVLGRLSLYHWFQPSGRTQCYYQGGRARTDFSLAWLEAA
jgi:hypothetical protein